MAGVRSAQPAGLVTRQWRSDRSRTKSSGANRGRRSSGASAATPHAGWDRHRSKVCASGSVAWSVTPAIIAQRATRSPFGWQFTKSQGLPHAQHAEAAAGFGPLASDRVGARIVRCRYSWRQGVRDRRVLRDCMRFPGALAAAMSGAVCVERRGPRAKA
jgi:hypothetical protein